MKTFHVPRIDLRYWAAIVLASVFGTNTGDYYAHNSGLDIGSGLAVLVLLTLAVFVAERLENRRHELYYWLVMIIVRTGATNIADWLAYRARIPGLELCAGLAALIALFGWWSVQREPATPGQPKTDAAYWLAMLGAGVFGTVLGDVVEHSAGKGVAAIACTLLFGLVLRFAGAGAAGRAVLAHRRRRLHRRYRHRRLAGGEPRHPDRPAVEHRAQRCGAGRRDPVVEGRRQGRAA